MSNELDDRARALEEIRRLAETHGLTLQEIAGTLARSQPGSGVASRVLGYLGGLFLFAGVAAFIAVNWDSLASLVRVLVTLGIGLSLFVAAFTVERQGGWPGFATPAYLAAGALQPTGILVAFDEYGSGGDWRIALIIMGTVLAIQALSALRMAANGVLVCQAIQFGALAAANLFDLAGAPGWLTALAVGSGMLLLAAGLDRGHYPWNVAGFSGVGSLVIYLGAFDLLEGLWLEPLFAAIGGLGIYLSVQARIRALLVTGILALLSYISYFTAEHFSDSLGWPLVLMLIGLLFVGLGVLAVRFNRRYFP
jgi:uncharacterized membrane protein